MNCDEFAKAIANGNSLSIEARKHLRSCSACSALAAIGERIEGPFLDPAAQDRIVAAITGGLTAVRPIAPAWHYALATAGAAIVVAVAGILVLGTIGWAADSLLQRLYFTTSLSVGIVLAALIIAKLMTPGALLLVGPSRTVPLGVISIVAGAFLYAPVAYDGFLRAVTACVSIGLTHAAVACALTCFIVRRGAFIWRVEMTSTIAMAGGLTGMAVLYVFCPHRDLGHFLLGHSTVPLAATAIGAWLGARLTGQSPR